MVVTSSRTSISLPFWSSNRLTRYPLPLLSSCVPTVASGKAKRGGIRGGLRSALPLATVGTQEQQLYLTLMKHTPYIHNERNQKIFRQTLRNNITSDVAINWRALKGKQVDGLKFRRQFGMGPYILSFYCPEIRLGIELDGGVHKTSYTNEYDEMRTRFFAENRIRILRFDNEVVYNNVEGIIEEIKGARSDHP